MSQIQRYIAEHVCEDGDDYKLWRSPLSADDKGTLVLYSDHLAAIAALEGRNKELESALTVAREFIENQQLPDAEWSWVLDVVVSALKRAS